MAYTSLSPWESLKARAALNTPPAALNTPEAALNVVPMAALFR